LSRRSAQQHAGAKQAAEKGAFLVEPAFRPASKSIIFIIPSGLLAREESAFLIFSAASKSKAPEHLSALMTLA